METLSELMVRVRQKLAENGVESPALDTRILVREGGQFSDQNMIAGGATPLSIEVIEKIDKMVDERAAGAPVSRIIGRREFWGLDFALSKDTLDPRPDTEILVEKALNFARKYPLKNASSGAVETLASQTGGDKAPMRGEGLRLLDLGTGTGCVLLALLHELPEATGVGVDLNPGAVDMARANAASLGLSDRAEFRCGSWFEPLAVGELFHVIVSNPPYIPEADIPNLAKEVRNHDPILALVGGKDGLDPYRHLFMETKKRLECGGRALYEFGAGQDDGIRRLVANSDANLIAVYPDLAGIPRVVEVAWG